MSDRHAQLLRPLGRLTPLLKFLHDNAEEFAKEFLPNPDDVYEIETFWFDTRRVIASYKNYDGQDHEEMVDNEQVRQWLKKF